MQDLRPFEGRHQLELLRPPVERRAEQLPIPACLDKRDDHAASSLLPYVRSTYWSMFSTLAPPRSASAAASRFSARVAQVSNLSTIA
jgi:hypothetical protein